MPQCCEQPMVPEDIPEPAIEEPPTEEGVPTVEAIETCHSSHVRQPTQFIEQTLYK